MKTFGTVADVAEMSGKSTNSVIRYSDDGKIDCLTTDKGHRLFIDPKESARQLVQAMRKVKKKKDDKEVKEIKVDQINSASAFWTRSKSELKKKDYNEFYKTISGDNEDSFMHMHTQAEGTIVYTTLFYIPKKAPFDLYYPEYKPGIKLYINRVFIFMFTNNSQNK